MLCSEYQTFSFTSILTILYICAIITSCDVQRALVCTHILDSRRNTLMSRIRALSAAAVLAAFCLICLVVAGCGGGGYSPTNTKPHVSVVPSENWATPDGYRVYVQARYFEGDISHPLSRQADGCIHADSEWRLDFWIVRGPGEVLPAGGIAGLMEVWNITFQLPQETTTKDWWLPVGDYRLTGKLTSGFPGPFETVRVEKGKG